MMQSSTPGTGVSLMAIEAGLTAIAVAVAFLAPRLGSAFFSPIERAFRHLARRQGLSVAVVGASALLLRLAILPWCPIPHPFLPTDFSFLLAADTFASGRLANPTPAMWQHFESIHITMQPTYASMYFPAQGLALAAGKVLFGRAWFGILASSALMCAALCWMLQAWLPPAWALLGGLLAVVHLGLFSYWVDTYSGGGCIAALGGALVLGAFPRFLKKFHLRDSLLLAIGVVLLATSRPYEGILLCLPVAFVLGRAALYGRNRPTPALLLRRTAGPLLLVLLAGAWMGYYNYRAFGNPWTPPYSIDRATYAMAPYFVWQSARPEPVYRHAAMRDFYYRDELVDYNKIHSLRGFLPETLIKAARGLIFFAGIALLPPWIMLRRVMLDRRIRFLVVCCAVLAFGMSIEIFLIVHYLAPFTAAFYAIGLQAMRHLRVWNPGGQPVGMGMVRFLVTVVFALAIVRVFAGVPSAQASGDNSRAWSYQWYGPGPAGRARAQVQAALEQIPGGQLVVVRYSASHDPFQEWVYNSANIDQSKIIWAREMNESSNCELIRYYRNRRVWLVQPDLQPVAVSPYPGICPLPTQMQARKSSDRLNQEPSKEGGR